MEGIIMLGVLFTVCGTILGAALAAAIWSVDVLIGTQMMNPDKIQAVVVLGAVLTPLVGGTAITVASWME